VVVIAVSHWSGRTCFRVCARRYPMVLGYRCDTYKIGEADWSIDCWRGDAVVHTGHAD
jgi:hypothetical protein